MKLAALSHWNEAFRRRISFCGAIALISLFGTLLHAQISEADKKKRDAFLKAREEMRTIPSSDAERVGYAERKTESGEEEEKRERQVRGKSGAKKDACA